MKKILFISRLQTHPIFGGSQQAMIAYADILRDLGYEVYFFLACQHFLKQEDFEATEKYWGKYFLYYKSSSITSLIHRIRLKLHKIYQRKISRKYKYDIDKFSLLGMNKCLKKINKQYDFDIIAAHYIWNTKAYQAFPNAKKVLFTHDCFSYRMERTGKESMYYFTTTPEEEKRGLDRSDAVLSIQEDESNFFRFLTKRPVYTVYCPVKLNITPFKNNKTILYLGGEYEVNIPYIIAFMEEVMPRLVAKDPEIKLLIAGTICKKLDKDKISLKDNISLLGRVDNVEDFYTLGDIAINPTERGSGMNIKSIQSLSCNKVLVAHPNTVKGFFDVNNLPIVLASNPDEYVKVILDLIQDPIKLEEKKKETANYITRYNTYVTGEMKKAFS